MKPWLRRWLWRRRHTSIYLANECVAKNDAPTIWFMTTLMGILKRLKPHEDPSSYRLIGLESCFLKGLMVLIH